MTLKVFAEKDGLVQNANVTIKNGKGSLVIVTMNEGIGRSAWEQRVSVRLNPDNAKLEVIGYDYRFRDKADLSSGTCSYNFNTGVGIVDRNGPEVDLNTDADEPPVIKNPYLHSFA